MTATVPARGVTDFAGIAEFDAFLGDPEREGSAIPFSRSLELDEASTFPGESVAALDSWGLQQHYVPREHGGRLDDVLSTLLLMRHVARRDVTAAVAHGKTFLGAVSAWVAGDDSTSTVAKVALSGDPISWGLTEPGLGSDLSATATRLDANGSGLTLTGRKWPINNATRGRAMTVLARTDAQRGPRSLSLVFLDRHAADGSRLRSMPKVATHGIRGADISGIEFDGVAIDGGALVGPRGHGLEIVLKSLQLTRPLCTALSLGAADQAVQLALDFAAGRVLYRSTLDSLPHARSSLAAAIADLAIAEVVAFTGARHIHSAPHEMAFESAAVKFFVPDTVDALFRDLTQFLGARSQIVGSWGFGRFQKAARDNRVVGIFDGNSVVNLNVVINEFSSLVRDSARSSTPAEIVAASDAFSAPAEFDATRLRLLTRSGSSLLRALPDLIDLAEDAGVHDEALELARTLLGEYRDLLESIRSAPRTPAPGADQFLLAERITVVFAGAAAIAFSLANRARLGDDELWRDDRWLRVVLERCCSRAGAAVTASSARDELFEAASARVARGVPVSVLPTWWTEDLS